MLLRLFSSNKQSVLFLLPFAAIVLWLRSFISADNFTVNPEYVLMPFYKGLISIVGINTLVSKILSLVLLIINAFLLGSINTRFLFIRIRTFLPAFIFILLSGIFVEIHLLHPAIPASLFIILALEKTMLTYKAEKESYNIFDASLLLSIASLFYFQALFLVLIIWAGLIVLRPFYWREWVFSILGVIVPYIFLYGISFVFFDGYNINFNAAFLQQFFFSGFKLTLIGKITFYYILFLIVMSSLFMIRVYGSKKVHSRMYFKYFLWIFIIVLLMLIFITSVSIEVFVILSIPLSYLISHYFINANKTRLNNFMFYALVILILLNQLV